MQPTTQVSPESPWPGLAAYGEEAAQYFQGRQAETEQLVHLVESSNLVFLYGESGVGKSSLLGAGVFPHLRARRFLPVTLRIDYSAPADPPLQQALERLVAEATVTGAHAQLPDADEGLWAYLQRSEIPIWSRDNFPLIPVLVFDQFEEHFSLGNASRHAIDSVADFVSNRVAPEILDRPDAERQVSLAQQYRVVLSFRSDFLPEVETWRERHGLVLGKRFRLTAMTRAAALSVVQSAAPFVEGGVAEKIVDFVRGDGSSNHPADDVEPALLSLYCFQLNRLRPPGGRIDSQILAGAGQGILVDFYNDALRGLPARVSEFIQENMIQGERYRGSFPLDEAIATGALTEIELNQLVDRRLLRVEEQRGTRRIELIHDRLVPIVRSARQARYTPGREDRVGAAEGLVSVNALRKTIRWQSIVIAVLLVGIVVLLLARRFGT